MLVFKKNIYADAGDTHPENIPESMDPYNFLLNALVSDRNIFISLQHIDKHQSQEQIERLYPHASRYGDLKILNATSKNLLQGLVNRDAWFAMNAYHLCYLYDALYGIMEEYSYGDMNQRMEMFPEMDGENINFDQFLEDYFISTAFLISEETFNSMPAENKEGDIFQIPCLFGVINKLVPTADEINLTQLDSNPYDPSPAS
ncbi:MAG: hypothetical protein G3M78_09820 [Candidatus Nitrohelix vancouverensis]|uniref:Uncharacterized protein n=1 Tax=Candidatus Nitrohelix vancouverensis TaxID=2705534 RepID=A0A7T0G3T9_9BACT|nr:MAG: hypothetical protein G3M78_09820 [Candidatus Nitrohelix vancouverensis]